MLKYKLPSMWKCKHSSAIRNASAGDDCSMEGGGMNHPQKGVFVHIICRISNVMSCLFSFSLSFFFVV